MRTHTAALTIGLVTGIGLAATAASEAGAAEIRVPEDVRSYRKALRKARPGDVITLAPGNYSGRLVLRKPGVTVRGMGAIFTARKNGAKSVVLRGRGSVIEGLSIVDGTVIVSAEDSTVRGLHLLGLERRSAIKVVAGGVRIENNHFDSMTYGAAGEAVIAVAADRAIVTGNRADSVVYGEAQWGPRGEITFVRVEGDDARVADNTLGVGYGTTGVHVIGDNARVSGNELHWVPDGVVVEGDSAIVADNTVSNGIGVAIEVVGDAAVLTENTVDGRWGDGLRVSGADYLISENDVTMEAFTDTPPTSGLQTQRAVAISNPNPDTPGATPQPTAQPTVQIFTAWCPGIVVRSGAASGIVSDNRIDHAIGTGIDAQTSNATFRDNVITATTRSSQSGLVLRGSGNVIEDNELVPEHFSEAFGMRITGSDNSIRRNTVSAAYYFTLRGIFVDGAANTIVDNELPGFHAHAISVSGAGSTIARNRIRNPKRAVQQNSGPLIDIAGNGNHVAENLVEDTLADSGNEFATMGAAIEAITIRGDENVVLLNRVEGLGKDRFAKKLNVFGARNQIASNIIVDSGDFGLRVSGDLNTIDSNQIINATPAPRVEDSSLAYRAAVYVHGKGNTVRRNRAEGAWFVGFRITGSGGVIDDNQAAGSGTDGLVIQGDAHRVCRNRSLDAAGTGFVIEKGSDNLVEDCVATGSGACGLESDAAMTSLLRNQLTGSGVHDLRITGTLDQFEGNVFDTLLRP